MTSLALLMMRLKMHKVPTITMNDVSSIYEHKSLPLESYFHRLAGVDLITKPYFVENDITMNSVFYDPPTNV